jgi:hypothetical protein
MFDELGFSKNRFWREKKTVHHPKMVMMTVMMGQACQRALSGEDQWVRDGEKKGY